MLRNSLQHADMFTDHVWLGWGFIEGVALIQVWLIQRGWVENSWTFSLDAEGLEAAKQKVDALCKETGLPSRE